MKQVVVRSMFKLAPIKAPIDLRESDDKTWISWLWLSRGFQVSDLDDLKGINRAWLYMETKVSVLQANVKPV